MPVFLYIGDPLRAYAFGDGHPFGPDRMDAFWKEACFRGIDRRVQICPPEGCSREMLERFHTPEYVERVVAQSALGRGYLDTGDTPAFHGIYEAASAVVGTTLAACRQVMATEGATAFIPIAGLHHARRGAAAGFCAFNDCGVAIESLRTEFALERIAYVDIDAHHGDGVFYAFEDDPGVLVADLHEDGRYLYPGTGQATETGAGAAHGTKLNIPMAPDAGDAAFMDAWGRVEDFLNDQRPEFILLQCGADSVSGDPITHLRYSSAAHGHAARRLAAIAEEHCQGRLVVMGGGGYNRTNLALAWCDVVEALLGEDPAREAGPPPR